MADEREYYDRDDHEMPADRSQTESGMNDVWDGDEGDAGEVPLRTIEDLDKELEALEAYAAQHEAVAEAGGDEGEVDAGYELGSALAEDALVDAAVGSEPELTGLGSDVDVIDRAVEPRGEGDEDAPPEDRAQTYERDAAPIDSLAGEERLRQPRAQVFRRTLRHKIGMVPLALFLIALGGYLLAKEHELADVPEFSNLTLGVFSLLAVSFTFVFHAFVFGRRERGLLFVGLYIWITAGMAGVVRYGIAFDLDWAEWWPLFLWSLGVTLIFTFLIERTHDARLVLLASYVLVSGGVAYWITSGEADQATLDTLADYWPLVLSVIGIGLLPAAFRATRGER